MLPEGADELRTLNASQGCVASQPGAVLSAAQPIVDRVPETVVGRCDNDKHPELSTVRFT